LVNTTVKARNTQESSDKTYCFDSTTHLTRSVAYRVAGVAVETRFANWLTVGDQVFPGAITRIENNVPVFTLTIQSVAVSPKVSDGAFGNR
jgi:hypothetical protein